MASRNDSGRRADDEVAEKRMRHETGEKQDGFRKIVGGLSFPEAIEQVGMPKMSERSMIVLTDFVRSRLLKRGAKTSTIDQVKVLLVSGRSQGMKQELIDRLKRELTDFEK